MDTRHFYDSCRSAKNDEAFDIKEIPATGEFDPHYHEALTHEASNTHQSGTIVTVFEKGYMMGSTVLRVAKVSVAQ